MGRLSELFLFGEERPPDERCATLITSAAPSRSRAYLGDISPCSGRRIGGRRDEGRAAAIAIGATDCRGVASHARVSLQQRRRARAEMTPLLSENQRIMLIKRAGRGIAI